MKAAIVALLLLGAVQQGKATIIHGTYQGIVTEAEGTRWAVGDQVTGLWSYDTDWIQPDGRVYLGQFGGHFAIAVGPSVFDFSIGADSFADHFLVDHSSLGLPAFHGNAGNLIEPVPVEEIAAAFQGGREIRLGTFGTPNVGEPVIANAVILGEFYRTNVPDGGSTLLMLAGAALGLFAIKRRPALAAAALLAVPCSAATFQIVSEFEPGGVPLVDVDATVNGTWHNDIIQNATTQEVGSLGLATSAGLAYSDTFAPIPVANGYSLLLTARTDILSPKWRITVYDNLGRSAVRDINPVSTSFTQYWIAGGQWDTTDPGFDPFNVTQFSLGGTGGNEPFHAEFEQMALVPEPAEYGGLAAIGLGIFAVVHRRRIAGIKPA